MAAQCVALSQHAIRKVAQAARGTQQALRGQWHQGRGRDAYTISWITAWEHPLIQREMHRSTRRRWAGGD
eukprot:1334601-Prorocentrum_lima.AAC.1